MARKELRLKYGDTLVITCDESGEHFSLSLSDRRTGPSVNLKFLGGNLVQVEKQDHNSIELRLDYGY